MPIIIANVFFALTNQKVELSTQANEALEA